MILIIATKDNQGYHEESYNVLSSDPIAWAKSVVDNYNKTSYNQRKFIGVRYGEPVSEIGVMID